MTKPSTKTSKIKEPETKSTNKKLADTHKEQQINSSNVNQTKSKPPKATELSKNQAKISESRTKQQILANQLYELVRCSGCNDEELLKALAVTVGNCVLVINQGNVNQSRIVVNNFADHIKGLISQPKPEE